VYTTDCRLQTTLQTTDYTTDYRQQTTYYRQQTTDCGVQTVELRHDVTLYTPIDVCRYAMLRESEDGTPLQTDLVCFHSW